jgi:hypothetical protein
LAAEPTVRGFAASLCAATLLALPLASGAAVYRCDVDGQLMYQDRPCAGLSSSENRIEIRGQGPVNTESTPPSTMTEWLERTSRENSERDRATQASRLEKENARLREEREAELRRRESDLYTSSDDRKAISQRYRTQIEDNQKRIQELRKEQETPR